jgi:hypothetical protein
MTSMPWSCNAKYLRQSVAPETAAKIRRSVRASLRPKRQFVAVAPDLPGTATPSLKKAGKFRKSRDRLRRFFVEHGQTIPACRHCRMTCGFPKKSWPNKQSAEEALARSGDVTGLNLYECPKQPGYWHLGGKGKKLGPKFVSAYVRRSQDYNSFLEGHSAGQRNAGQAPET